MVIAPPFGVATHDGDLQSHSARSLAMQLTVLFCARAETHEPDLDRYCVIT
jgi:hypothetical protein